jgi:hypothetical protein
MTSPEPPRPRGLRLHDLVGLVVGYGMAALLARAFWPRSRPLTGIPAAALGLEFLWLGLAMSGPIVLLLDRRGPSTIRERPRKPPRLGRLISAPEPVGPPIGQGPAADPGADPWRYTRAELAWLLIGGYWISFTFFVVSARSLDTPWALACLLQFVAALGLLVVVPRRAGPGKGSLPWTHFAALSLLYSWPIAWVFLIVLSGSF